MQRINDAYGLIRDHKSRENYIATAQMMQLEEEAYQNVPMFSIAPTYDWANRGDRKKLQRALLSQGASLGQKTSSCFDNAVVIPGKFRVFSQNISIELLVSLGQDIPPVSSKRSVVLNQMI